MNGEPPLIRLASYDSDGNIELLGDREIEILGCVPAVGMCSQTCSLTTWSRLRGSGAGSLYLGRQSEISGGFLSRECRTTGKRKRFTPSIRKCVRTFARLRRNPVGTSRPWIGSPERSNLDGTHTKSVRRTGLRGSSLRQYQKRANTINWSKGHRGGFRPDQNGSYCCAGEVSAIDLS